MSLVVKCSQNGGIPSILRVLTYIKALCVVEETIKREVSEKKDKLFCYSI